MRRFFRAHRDEDYSQIQYLTAKCNRLAHDKVVLERECVATRERARSLQDDLEAVARSLFHQEQLNMELRIQHEQLVSRLRHQQDLVAFLQQHVSQTAEGSSRDAALLGLHLEEVHSELLNLQSSEVQLEGLVEELHAEALHRAARTESLQAELHSRTAELEKLQSRYVERMVEQEELRSAHQRKVGELQQENEGSLKKLQETAEQFEWLCEQQRYWMSCVKRFKACLTDEKEALLHHVDTLEKKVAGLKAELRTSSEGPSQTLLCPLQDINSQCCDRTPLWDQDMLEEGTGLYKEVYSQVASSGGVSQGDRRVRALETQNTLGERAVDRHQEPP